MRHLKKFETDEKFDFEYLKLVFADLVDHTKIPYVGFIRW